MYACMFNGWSGLELDTIVSIEPTYIDIGKERVDGVAFYTATQNGFDMFIPMKPDDTDEFIRSIAGIYPGIADLTDFDAIHVDDEEHVDADEWAWYTGRPAKKGLFDKAMSKMGLTE